MIAQMAIHQLAIPRLAISMREVIRPLTPCDPEPDRRAIQAELKR
jgi:hypothetical protein